MSRRREQSKHVDLALGVHHLGARQVGPNAYAYADTIDGERYYEVTTEEALRDLGRRLRLQLVGAFHDWRHERPPVRRVRLSLPPIVLGDFVCLTSDEQGEAGVVEAIDAVYASVRWARGVFFAVEVIELRRLHEPPPRLWCVLDVGPSRRIEDGLEVWGLGETIADALKDACESDSYVMTVHEKVVPLSLRDVAMFDRHQRRKS